MSKNHGRITKKRLAVDIEANRLQNNTSCQIELSYICYINVS